VGHAVRRRRARRAWGEPERGLWRRSVRRSDKLKAECDVSRKRHGFGKSKIVDASLEAEGICRGVCGDRID